jgi:hypothetical protein
LGGSSVESTEEWLFDAKERFELYSREFDLPSFQTSRFINP